PIRRADLLLSVWHSAGVHRGAFMRHLICTLALTSFLALHGGAATAWAQAAQPDPAQFEQMTAPSPAGWLKNLGFTVEEKSNNLGQRYWSVQSQQNGWNYIVELSPYRNNKGQINGFWLVSKLGKPLDTNQLPTAQTLLNILERNHT